MMMKRTLSLLLAFSMASSMASGALAANVVPEENRVPANVMAQSAYENLKASIRDALPGATVALTENVSVPYSGEGGIKADMDIAKNLTIDMDAYSVTRPKYEGTPLGIPALFNVNGPVTVTVKGKGTSKIDANLGANNSIGIILDNKDAVLNIEGGTFAGAPTAIAVKNGTLNIKGGYFLANNLDNSNMVISTITDTVNKNNFKISITGGTFAGYDPSKYVGEGFKVTENAGYYTVSKNDGIDALIEEAKKKDAENKKKADEVIEKIKNIGKIELSEAFEERFNSALNSYNALTDQQKLLVPNAGFIKEAGEKFAELVRKAEAEAKEKKEKAEAAAVSELIEKIGEVKYPDSSDSIRNARNAYNALNDEQKKLILNLDKLTGAEAGFNELAKEEALKNANQEEANKVIDKINLIGEVSLTSESKAKIADARAAFNGLTNDQQKLVVNIEVLKLAEERVRVLEEAENVKNQQEKLDKEKAAPVINMINSMGEIKYPSSEVILKAVRKAYNNLTEAQKKFVTNYDKLTEAEKKFDELKEAENIKDQQDAEDKLKASPVVDMINRIGEVKYPGHEAILKGIRNNYNNLTANQKKFVTNYDKLTEAEKKFEELKKAAEESANTNKVKAEAVEKKINEIGAVKYDTASKNKIDEARKAYEALTSEQKKLVKNLSTLVNAENAYEALKKAETSEEKTKEDKRRADDVINKINSIGEVTLSNNRIKEARKAYDALTYDQQKLVTNYSKLKAAEDKYNKLYNDKLEAQKVIDKIDSIGTVSKNDASRKRVEDARKAYNALTYEQRKLVSNYYKLTNAENALEAVENKIVVLNDLYVINYDTKELVKATDKNIYYDDEVYIVVAKNGVSPYTNAETMAYENFITSNDDVKNLRIGKFKFSENEKLVDGKITWQKKLLNINGSKKAVWMIEIPTVKNKSITSFKDVLGEYELDVRKPFFLDVAADGKLIDKARYDFAFTINPDKQSGDEIYDGSYVYEFNDTEDDELELYNGDGLFIVDTRGQKPLVISTDVKYNTGIEKADPDANYVYYNANYATFNKIGDLYLRADPHSYIYKVDKETGKLSKLNAKYDRDEEAFKFRTRTLGCYVVAEKELDLDKINKIIYPEAEEIKPLPPIYNPPTGANI